MRFFKHDLALVDSKKIGAGTRIWEHVHVLPDANIGENCNICAFSFIENAVVIGDRVTIKCGVYIWDGITIGNDVFIGPNVTFSNDIRPRSKKHLEKPVETVIENGVTIGANATIVAGITIGEYAMIGAGAVVTKSIPNNTLWYGNPARLKGYICKCGQKLNVNLECIGCQDCYKINENGKIERND